MGNDILFSVVVPAYNRRIYLEKLIQRFNGIVYSNWELIVVDDGSSDDTRQFFEANTFKQVKYIYQSNGERAAARNRGLKESSGQYITFLDSDDYLIPEVFTIASEIINANSDIPVFHLGYEIRDVNDRLIRKAEVLPDLLNDVLVERNVMACLGLFIKRETALSYFFNEDRDLSGTEDYELWIRMAAGLPVRHFNKTVAVLVEHEGRSMQELNVNKMVRRIELFIHYAISNPDVLKYLGGRKAKFIAFRYSYIALHAALAANKRLSISFLAKTVGLYPQFIFNKRALVIVKKLIFG